MILSTLVGSIVAVPRPVAADTYLEYELLELINGGRSGRVPMHIGLQLATREHSRDMANRMQLFHVGADGMMNDANPDPPEPNGAPDDGYAGRYCENVGYVSGSSRAVAERIYEAWRESPGHHRCMTAPGMSAAGVGLYSDGSGWWATFELIVDRSPPGSTMPEPRPRPLPLRSVVVLPEPPRSAEPVPTDPPVFDDISVPEAPAPSPPAVRLPQRGRVQAAFEAVDRTKATASRTGGAWTAILATLTAVAAAGTVTRRRSSVDEARASRPTRSARMLLPPRPSLTSWRAGGSPHPRPPLPSRPSGLGSLLSATVERFRKARPRGTPGSSRSAAPAAPRTDPTPSNGRPHR